MAHEDASVPSTFAAEGREGKEELPSKVWHSSRVLSKGWGEGTQFEAEARAWWQVKGTKAEQN